MINYDKRLSIRDLEDLCEKLLEGDQVTVLNFSQVNDIIDQLTCIEGYSIKLDLIIEESEISIKLK